MALRYWRFREVFRLLPRFLHSGDRYKQYRGKSPVSFLKPLSQCWVETTGSNAKRVHTHWCSIASETRHDCSPELNVFTFFQSVLDKPEGPYHCWFNKIDERREPSNRDGIFLVIMGGFVEDSMVFSRDHVVMFERVKLLQQRYPMLHVFGCQFGCSFNSVAAQIRIVQTLIKEYITFPILLSNKYFDEMTDAASYMLFQDFKSPLLYHEKDLDLERLVKVIEELNATQNVNIETVQNSKSSTWVRVSEVVKDPYACSSFRNLLLFYPGSISVDEDGDRLFLSDTNHHRIIIADGNGKLLDCIGSSPGFEDGEFESAKLLRPAASVYDAAEDCLYIVDSENHAVRRAILEKRVLGTIYPICNPDKRVGSLWSWILDKLGIRRDVDPKPKEFDLNSFAFPWHLLKSEENDLFIINRSFETLWIMNVTTGVIKEVINGFPNIMEVCGQMIREKVASYQEVLGSWLQQRVDHSYSIEELPYAGLMSSFATFKNTIIFCDPVGQRVLKCCRESKDISNIQFSNFGILGLPYWLASPLERAFIHGDIHERPRNDRFQYFNLLPGRCDIRVNINLPEGTELAEPLQEGSIWRQARGSAVEVLGSDSVLAASKKVGAAQQCYDELYSVIFAEPEMESTVEEKNLDKIFQEENTLHFDCAVNISPGSSEVVIYTVLYLKLEEKHNSFVDQGIKTAETVLDIRNDDKSKKQGGNACAQLLESFRDLRDIIFMKPLHLRIRLNVDDYPVADKDSDNLREMVLPTDSFIKVNVSLD